MDINGVVVVLVGVRFANKARRPEAALSYPSVVTLSLFLLWHLFVWACLAWYTTTVVNQSSGKRFGGKRTDQIQLLPPNDPAKLNCKRRLVFLTRDGELYP